MPKLNKVGSIWIRIDIWKTGDFLVELFTFLTFDYMCFRQTLERINMNKYLYMGELMLYSICLLDICLKMQQIFLSLLMLIHCFVVKGKKSKLVPFLDKNIIIAGFQSNTSCFPPMWSGKACITTCPFLFWNVGSWTGIILYFGLHVLHHCCLRVWKVLESAEWKQQPYVFDREKMLFSLCRACHEINLH